MAAHRLAEQEELLAPHFRYYAFLSYSHEDHTAADWLHSKLESFKVPEDLVGRPTKAGVVPNRLAPIFRDRPDLAAADDLAAEILSALAASKFLIVLCSQAAAKSRWINAEIDAFKRIQPNGSVLAVIIDGEPFATDNAGHEQEECFPPALRFRYDRRGRRSVRRAEPVAADLRENRDGRRVGFLKLVAGMLGVRLDELVQRDARRQHRRLALFSAVSIGGMIVTSTLAAAAIESRIAATNARDAESQQRREAEGLIAFMLGDLQQKLDPTDRLDALHAVGNRALEYYKTQDPSRLSDQGLVQRSMALTLLARAASKRGENETAEKFYGQALAGTAEAIRRNPNDPRQVFNHAQIVFWRGEAAHQRGDLTTLESSMRQYRLLSQRLTKLQPNEPKWRMEVRYADTNLGVLFYEQRRFHEAVMQFEQALRGFEPLTTARSGGQGEVVETVAWLADAKAAEGKLAEAISLRGRQVAMLNRLPSSTGDVDYQRKLIPAHQALGRLYAMTGQTDMAAKHFGSAVAAADKRIPIDDPSSWYHVAVNARLAFAAFLLDYDKASAGATQIQTACNVADKLAAQTADQLWSLKLRDCSLMRARLALLLGNRDRAALQAKRAIELSKSDTNSDRAANGLDLARAHRILGDVYNEAGNAAGARAEWSEGLAALPQGMRDTPTEMHERARIWQRIGRSADAARIVKKLNAMGYRFHD